MMMKIMAEVRIVSRRACRAVCPGEPFGADADKRCGKGAHRPHLGGCGDPTVEKHDDDEDQQQAGPDTREAPPTLGATACARSRGRGSG